MRLSDESCRTRLESTDFAVLATINHDGSPHAVPVVFALDEDVVVIPIDRVKPKSTARLRRLDNVRREPRATLLADYRSSDWTALWWVRADLRLIEIDRVEGSAALADRYEQYRHPGTIHAVMRFSVERYAGWASADRPFDR